MKAVITVLGLLNGLYMLIDGVFVMMNGKYIGPEKPGPWALLFEKLGIDVFKLGPLFVVFGVLWLVWIYGLWTVQPWAFPLGIIICLLTLWYIPVGTVFSLIVLAVILFARKNIGI